jgi:hypothetical protein
MRATLRLVAVALAAAGAPAAALEVPKGTEVMDLDYVPGKLGKVRFQHARHNDEFKRPDGTAVRCKDCHHRLAGDEPASATEDMKCTGCHARYGDPPKTIGGKVAPALASLRPDGAIEYKSILFHEWCWACHHRTMRDGHRNDRCKRCHERGIGSDTMHGRYDAMRQPGTGLSWMHCSAGARWNGKACDGEPRGLPWNEALASCPSGYRLPTRAEALGLLEADFRGKRSCAASETCAALFGADPGPFWTADAAGEAIWTVKPSDGSTAAAAPTATARVRCVQAEP